MNSFEKFLIKAQNINLNVFYTKQSSPCKTYQTSLSPHVCHIPLMSRMPVMDVMNGVDWMPGISNYLLGGMIYVLSGDVMRPSKHARQH